MTAGPIELDLEIRHLDASKLTKLSSIIDNTNGLDDLLGYLMQPKAGCSIEPLKLTLDSIDCIKQQVKCGKSPTLALLKHWSITGRRRPTVRTLLIQLRCSGLRWAADFVEQNILGRNLNALHHLDSGQAMIGQAQGYTIDAEFQFDQINDIIKVLNNSLNRYSFRSIYESTNQFCHKPYHPTKNEGTRVGDGRFSSVFRATTHLEPSGPELIVAAKLLKSECNRRYLANEINLAMRIGHENILQLLGISIGDKFQSKSYLCLIYPYIQNGSLLQCLSNGLVCQNRNHLTSEQRIRIATGIAKGIAYLHNFEDKPIIHRDIKTANILIDENFEPKIGDFTLVRQLDCLPSSETQYSSNVIGTSIYMPPEAFRGDISVKFDIFSFGVVMLELLTGLRPFDESSNEDLLTHINEKLFDIENELEPHKSLDISTMKDKFIMSILDEKAGVWNFDAAKRMFLLALRATESRKRDRPEIDEILKILIELEPPILI